MRSPEHRSDQVGQGSRDRCSPSWFTNQISAVAYPMSLLEDVFRRRSFSKIERKPLPQAHKRPCFWNRSLSCKNSLARRIKTEKLLV